MKALTLIITGLLLFGIVFRLILTSNNNFIFHMDNARDMVDVREMVDLQKFRLIGPTSGIEGFYNGPSWYYLMVIPYVISSGNPYSMILAMITVWAIGGYFLLKIIRRWGKSAVIFAGSIWVASNLLILNTQNSLSPNPVILLMPIFAYLLEQYINTKKIIYSVLVFILAGMFFHFEMAFGIFIPAIIVISIIWLNKSLFKSKSFWIGFGLYILVLSFQILFDIKHQFIMTNSVLKYLTSGEGGTGNYLDKIGNLWSSYFSITKAMFMNIIWLVWVAFGSLLVSVYLSLRKNEDNIVKISILVFLVPLVGYLILPIKAMSWHIQGSVSILLITATFVLYKLMKKSRVLTILISLFVLMTFISSIVNVKDYLSDTVHSSIDPAVLRNEIAAVDYVYQKADGKNFKVYIYLPSVIDYPYQYIFPWYGVNKYGYLPKDYAYSPNKPEYISSKEKLNKGKTVEDSNLIFLIKQPDTTGIRHLWENTFTKYPLLETNTVGPLVIETRTEQ